MGRTRGVDFRRRWGVETSAAEPGKGLTAVKARICDIGALIPNTLKYNKGEMGEKY